MLVLRLVNDCDRGHWHICNAQQEFVEGAIVTLEALCGRWAFGTLSRLGIPEWQSEYPADTLCGRCNDLFLQEWEAVKP